MPHTDADGLRWLRPREAARCQGISEDTKLPDRREAAWHMVGNALSPTLAAVWVAKVCAVHCSFPAKQTAEAIQRLVEIFVNFATPLRVRGE
eukprot:6421919-Alexandrium_andersonii.AAC.1